MMESDVEEEICFGIEEEDWKRPLESDGVPDIPAGMKAAISEPSTSREDGNQAAMEETKSNQMISRMGLNTNKAGMEGLDKERINKIIYEASKGSRFYENEQKKEQQVNERIQRMKEQCAKITQRELVAAQTETDHLVEQFENERDLSRLIVHIDMDMFYAAVEMLDNPELREKPMAVGGIGMLSTSNYVARKYGVRAAMPGFIGKKLCPDLIIVPTNFKKYRESSNQVREILAQYDPNFSPMSLDEAYLDFTEHIKKRATMCDDERTFEYREESEIERGKESSNPSNDNFDKQERKTLINDNKSQADDGDHQETEEKTERKPRVEVFGISVEEAVREMRFRIQQKTRLTASAGIAPNCMLAKIGSDMNKPNGQFRLQPTRDVVMEFIQKLPIRKVSGIGKVTERILSELGVTICSHLLEKRALLHILFLPTSSHHFLRISLGLGSAFVSRDGERKSMSTERTFREISRPEDLYRKCQELCEALAEDLEKDSLQGKTVTVKLKTVNFEVKTRAKSVAHPISTAEDIFAVARDILKVELRAVAPHPLKLRLMGVRLSSFVTEDTNGKQPSLISLFKKRKPDPSDHNETVIPSTEDTLQEDSLVTNLLLDPYSENPSLILDNPRTATEGDFVELLENVENQINTEKSSAVSNNEELHHHYGDITSLKNYEQTSSCLALEEHSNQSGSSVSNFDYSVSVCKKQAFLCPVCNKERLYQSLEEFNQHVDLCLNKDAISDILEHQRRVTSQRSFPATQSSHNKRSFSSSSSSSKKRHKGEKPSSSTLHQFFTKR